MPIIFPLILEYVKNFEDADSFATSIGVLSDISRNLHDKFYPYVKDVMEILLLNLKNNLISVNIYGVILEFFGDVALAIEEKFTPYLKEVLSILEYAHETKIKKVKSSRSITGLKESIITGYAGIIQGLGNYTNFEEFKVYIPGLITLTIQFYFDKNGKDCVKKYCIGIIGDLGAAFKSNVKDALDTVAIKSIINRELKSSDVERKRDALWTKNILDKI
jgi:importin subunit beta-1